MHQNRNVCRTCLSVGDATFHSLDTIPNFDLISIKEKMSACVPELSLDIVPDAVICAVCLTALHAAFIFKMKCRKTEQQIRDYIYNKKCNFSEVDLRRIIASMDDDNLDTDLSDEEPSDLRINFKKSDSNHIPNIIEKVSEIKNEVIESLAMDVALVKAEPMDYTSESEEAQQQNNDNIPIETDVVINSFDNSSKPHKCTICEKTYKREIGLIAHMRMHETNQANLTKQASLDSEPLNEIKQFLPKQLDNIDAVCEICQKSFYSKSNLTVHMRIHTGEKPYKCNTCKKAFTQKVYLVAHERTHTGEKPFKCSLCDKSFAQKSYLRTHMIVHTGVRHHICKVCGKGCAHTGDLNNHMRIHTGEKPYKCMDCGKCFTQSVHLKSHIKIHSGEKPFECQLCNAKYTESRYLKKHMRVHSGERPYRCDICKKTFHEKYILTEHMRSHTGEKPCVCTVCYKTYSKTSHLTEHMRTHTGEKPYCCKDCGMNFAYKQSLNAHLKVHKKNDFERSLMVIKSEPSELNSNGNEPCTSNLDQRDDSCRFNSENDVDGQDEISHSEQDESPQNESSETENIKSFLNGNEEGSVSNDFIKDEPESEDDDGEG